MEIPESKNHLFGPTPPQYKLYSQKAIDLATLLGTFIAGSFLLAANFRNLDNSNSSRNTILLGIAAFGIYTYAFILLEQALDVVPDAAFHILPIAAIHLYGKWTQAEALSRHEKLNGTFHSMWRAAGISLLTLPISVAVLALASILASIPAQSTPENFEVAVDSPAVVEQGSNFQIRVHLINNAASEQTLVYVAVTNELLEGMTIERSEPPFSRSQHLPWARVFDYGLSIPPSDRATITLLASAIEKGDHAGDLDFCINTELSCLYRQLHIRVE